MIPGLEKAQSLLIEAAQLNPGPWVAHSLNVAQAAQLIASHHPRLDPERAYILGCLHDIGRRYGVSGMRHVLDGYRFLTGEGYEDAGRVCLTHAYPLRGEPVGASPWDGSGEELDFVQAYLAGIEYDDYDQLIQLCDALTLPTGFCLMEKRLVEVALRYGVNKHTLRRWQAYFDLKDEIEQAIGASVYSLLPHVVENTFGLEEGTIL
jgi:hypothetical protein